MHGSSPRRWPAKEREGAYLLAMSEPSFIEAYGAPRLGRLLLQFLVNRHTLHPEIRRTMDASALEFVAANVPLLNAVTGSEEFVAGHPDIVQELVERSRSKSRDNALPSPSAGTGATDRSGGIKAEGQAPSVEIFTSSQLRALARMKALARLHAESPVKAGVRLRTLPLIVGPSGVGKSHLVRALGAHLKTPVFRICMGDWIPLGAKTDVSAMARIQRALDASPDGLILNIDELDKLRLVGSEVWSLSQITEALSLLDCTPLGSWTETQLERLRRAYIIGSGTWQSIFETKPACPIGFQGEYAASESQLERIRKAQVIPTELLSRFNQDWLILDPFTAGEFRRIVSALGLGPGVLDPEAAAASGLNFRAVQNALTAFELRRIEADLNSEIATGTG